ncbi:MAG: ABC transporter substrate-binding protein [Alphaproteobacteria bacterium]|nr:ABC transporter substrate-binding protein [Alphaproteobacteria bacterium]
MAARLSVASTLGIMVALGSAQAQTLNMGFAAPFNSADPHFYNASPNISLSLHVFDALTVRDERVRPQPGLAESWRVINDTTWEFKLRPNVRWHDGKPFTAADVVASLRRPPNVPNSPGSFAGFVRAIREVQVVDPTTIRIITRSPHPLLPIDLGAVFIVQAEHAEKATTEDFNAMRATAGTGPYRLSAFRVGESATLERNENWWGTKPHWQRVNIRFIGNDTARTAALLAGDVDFIDQVSSTDLPRLRQDQRVRIEEVQGLRMIYLTLDQFTAGAPAGVADAAGNPLSQNPFKDRRVREALSIAINRQAIVDRVMEGTARPNGQWLPPGVFGHNPQVPVPTFDPDRARRLLAEAGYPNGFRLVFSTPNNRYPNDDKTAQAIAQFWQRIGVQTTLQALPWTAFAPRSARLELPVRLSGWGSSTGEASYTLINVLGTYSREQSRGSVNHGRYSNPALDALTDRAVATLDDERREELLRQAVKMAMEDAGIIPIHQLINYWAMRRNLSYVARMDERTLAMGVRPAN